MILIPYGFRCEKCIQQDNLRNPFQTGYNSSEAVFEGVGPFEEVYYFYH